MTIIDGIGLSGFRSFGPNMEYVGPFGKMNIIIGRNNSGKSNILLYISQYYNDTILKLQRNKPISFPELNRNVDTNEDELKISIGIQMGGGYHEEILNSIKEKNPPQFDAIESAIDWILNSEPLSNSTDLAWFTYEVASGRSDLSSTLTRSFANVGLPNNMNWSKLCSLLSLEAGGNRQARVEGVLNWLSPVRLQAPKIDIIPAFRQIEDTPKKEASQHSGGGLITELAEMQNPDLANRKEKERFEKINKFLKTVLENHTAELEIPFSRQEIIIKMDGKELPLQSVGTGVHEVIIMAAKATIFDNQVVCIEEPELHLHPSLQRKLVSYLYHDTNNQYFVTTHSSHFMDTVPSQIFHVQLNGRVSTVHLAENSNEKSEICSDLGYRATDLIQANSVIWVEGPSDRIYINHWLQQVDSEIIERIHYSIMFYGGKLLSHLSGSDQEVSDFISLKRLNRFSAVVMDRDTEKSGAPVNETKKRIKSEFEKSQGFVWITKGREIENYVDLELMYQAILSLYPDAVKLENRNNFSKRYEYRVKSSRKPKTPNKVKLAKKIVSMNSSLELLDLKKQVRALVKYIRDANGI